MTFIKGILFVVILVMLLEAAGFAITPANVYTRIMMHEMYTEEPIDIVFIGASRTYRGIDPATIDEELNVNSFNMGSSAQDTDDTYYLLKEMFKYHSPEIVVVDVTQNNFYERKSIKNSEILFDYYKASIDKAMYLRDAFGLKDYYNALFPALRKRNRNIKSTLAPARIIENLKTKLSPEYLGYSYSMVTYDDEWYAGKGFVYSVGNIAEDYRRNLKSYAFDKERINARQVALLEKVVRLCQDNGSTAILINMPLPLANMARYEGYTEYSKVMNDFALKNNVDFYDFGLIRNDVFAREDDACFRDSNHLNGLGAKEFCKALARFLNERQNGSLNVDDYLYGSYEALMEGSKYVFGVWLAWDQDRFKADAVVWGDTQPEFEFSYKIEGEDSFTVFRPYDADPYVPELDAGGKSFVLRVNARAIGHEADFERFSELEIRMDGMPEENDEEIDEDDLSDLSKSIDE